MGEHASDSVSRGALSAEKRAAIIRQLNELGEEVAGPNVADLVDLVEQISIEPHKPIPAVHASLADFVPNDKRAVFDAEEQDSRRALRNLINEAKKTSKLTKPSPKVSPAELEPFVCALMRLCNLPINGNAVEKVLSAVKLLASLDVVLVDDEKRGPNPIFNLCRATTRATLYYRANHGLPLSVDFEYLDRAGVKPGARSRRGELVPMSPSARLACEVVKAFDVAGDEAEVQTHLRKYWRELEDEARGPRRSDFLLKFD